MVGSGAERRGVAERRRETRHVRALSGIIPCIAMQGAGLRGRVGVVAKRRLGVERSGNEVLQGCRRWKQDDEMDR